MFKKENLVEYFTASGKTSYILCPDCLAKKLEREKFQDTICEILGIRSPGPRIWAQRKRLSDKYGYTDETIVECLRFLHDVKHYEFNRETLGLVAPWSIEEMNKWKKAQQAKASSIAASISTMETHEYLAPVCENTSSKKQEEEFIDD